MTKISSRQQSRGPGGRLSSWGDRNWLFALFLVVAVFLAYQPVWHAGFIWDDDEHLTQNPCIVGPLGFKDIWTGKAVVYYPLVLTSFWLQHAFWGLNPLPYHLVNIALHAACAVLLWRVLRSLNVHGAWLGAALWVLHPVQVESAAWITELKNTQSCFFYLLAILFFLKWLEVRALAARNEHGQRSHYLLALLCAVLAILSKSSTVMLPAVFGLCWWWIDRRWRWSNVIWLAPVLTISLAASGWTIWEQKFHSGALGQEWMHSAPERIVMAGQAIWFYLGKLLWPHPLIFIYPRWEIDASKPMAYLPALTAIAGLFVLWRNRNGWMRPAFFAFVYFVVSLFPVLGFFNVFYFRYSLVADHFQYLASIGPLALAASGITTALDPFHEKKPFLKPMLCGTLLLGMAVLTWQQGAMYRDLETLWRTTIARNPGCWMAYNNLGMDLARKGRMDDAIAQYQKSLEIRPHHTDARLNLSIALVQKGQVDEAIVHLRKILEIVPGDIGTHFILADALLKKGRAQEAGTHFQQALDLFPEDLAILNNLAPRKITLLNNFAWLLATFPEASVRDGVKAIELARRAETLSGGGDPVILDTLAAAYAEVGRFSEAAEGARRALKLALMQENTALADALRKRIALYEAGLPYREQPLQPE